MEMASASTTAYPLSLTYQTSTNDVRQETQAMIRDWWGDLGIEVNVLHHDASVFFGGDPVEDREQVYRPLLRSPSNVRHWT